MARYPYSPGATTYQFGPGPISPAVKLLIIVNVAAFLVTWIAPRALERAILLYLGLSPAAVFEAFLLWQPATYMFLHGGMLHLLFNMLILWMFGVELERMWGTPFFVKYYFVTGVGAAVTTMIVALLPFEFAEHVYASVTIGASGAIYGLLLAFALHFPNRPILMFLLFPIPAKYFVMILGAIAFLSSTNVAGGTAHTAHLGGLVIGYLYLARGGRRGGGLMAEIKYRYIKWKMNRLRRRFDVYSGGRHDDWDKRVH
jgi:membrane associated rhomboid family serine protease